MFWAKELLKGDLAILVGLSQYGAALWKLDVTIVTMKFGPSGWRCVQPCMATLYQETPNTASGSRRW